MITVTFIHSIFHTFIQYSIDIYLYNMYDIECNIDIFIQ